MTVDPREAGLGIDYPASIEEAGGGSGFGLTRMWEVVTGGGDHHAEVAVDQSEMQAALDELSSGLGERPVEGDIEFRDGRAVPVFGKAGQVVSRGATQELLERRFLHGGSQKLPTEVKQPEVSDGRRQRGARDVRRAGDVRPGDPRPGGPAGWSRLRGCSPRACRWSPRTASSSRSWTVS